MLAFRIIDTDSSKTITFQEFETYYKRCTTGKPNERFRPNSMPS